jgi:hypothetical protein
MRETLRALVLASAVVTATACADPAPFDLAGPRLYVDVSRGDATLPVTAVPGLAVGDRLRLRPGPVQGSGARYTLVAAFLRGPTNPPPDEWFSSCDAWSRGCIERGLEVTVPDGAQQVLVFFAPKTAAGERTLRKTVQGRPGAFVRAAQELRQAALDHARLERYLTAVRELGADDPGALRDGAPLLARSLGIRVDEKCLDRLPALQAPCLMRGQESLILNDDVDPSLVATLTSGPASDLAMQAGNTAMFDRGAYVPYIGSLLDIARLMDSFRTAHYQYIPALTTQRGDGLALLLNTPPSFREPQSVLVAALPPVEVAHPPVLRAADPAGVYCAARESLVLPVHGAPLAFATGYAHGLALRAARANGATVEVPARMDALAGGVVADTHGLVVDAGQPVSLVGMWGFEPLQGPRFRLANPSSAGWRLAHADGEALVVGRTDIIHLVSDGAPCASAVHARGPDGRDIPLEWTADAPDRLALHVDLSHATPGPLTLAVDQYGVTTASAVIANAFADPGRLGGFEMHAADTSGSLTGSRLDLVDRLTIGNSVFVPETLTTDGPADTLLLRTDAGADTTTLAAGARARGTVLLKDGRTLTVDVRVTEPRPRVELLAKSVLDGRTDGTVRIDFGSPEEVRPEAVLTFSIRALLPDSFSHDAVVDVATVDESASARLSLTNGGLKLADSRVAVATLEPAAVLGPSAFGPLKFRLVQRGAIGDWQSLATLVRLPGALEVSCADRANAGEADACVLRGRDLFLLEAVGRESRMRDARSVADGFPGRELAVPHPLRDRLFVRLRDDPAVVSVMRIAPAAGTGSDRSHDSGSGGAGADVQH